MEYELANDNVFFDKFYEKKKKKHLKITGIFNNKLKAKVFYFSCLGMEVGIFEKHFYFNKRVHDLASLVPTYNHTRPIGLP